MRLLQKSDIAKAKSVAQRRDIEEGVKIAKRVDNLREVAAQEEAALIKFRKETLAKIHAETQQASQEKDSLVSEVAVLRKERKELMRPLDKEWGEITKEHAVLAEREQSVEAQEIVLHKEAAELKKAVKQVSDSLVRTATKEASAIEQLLSASQTRKEAKLALKEAQCVEAKAIRLAKDVREELIHRDMAMATREREYTMKEEKLSERESALEKEWKLLNDRKAMFERRIKKPKK